MAFHMENRTKILSLLKNKGLVRGISTVDEKLHFLPVVIQRAQSLMDGTSGQYLDRLMMTTILGDGVRLNDSGLDAVLQDVIRHSTKNAKTENRAIRRCVESKASERAAVISAVRHQKMESRSGVKHFWPGFCDYCDLIVAISEMIQLRYSEVYRAFGGEFGHYNVLRGNLPLSRRKVDVTVRNSFLSCGFDWHDASGSIGPKKVVPPKHQNLIAQLEMTTPPIPPQPSSPPPPPTIDEVDCVVETPSPILSLPSEDEMKQAASVPFNRSRSSSPVTPNVISNKRPLPFKGPSRKKSRPPIREDPSPANLAPDLESREEMFSTDDLDTWIERRAFGLTCSVTRIPDF